MLRRAGGDALTSGFNWLEVLSQMAGVREMPNSGQVDS
jgi:hypothetical protein